MTPQESPREEHLERRLRQCLRSMEALTYVLRKDPAWFEEEHLRRGWTEKWEQIIAWAKEPLGDSNDLEAHMRWDITHPYSRSIPHGDPTP